MEILKHKTVKTLPYIELIDTAYTNMEGHLSSWQWVRRIGNRKAVVIAAVTEGEEKKLVVIREYRVPIEGYELGFPAGLIDKGESPEDAVRRELEEETGLKVEEIVHISPEILSSAGLTNEAIHMAYVKVSGVPNKDKLEDSDDIETFLLNRDEVESLMLQSDDRIGKSAYGVMRNFVKFGEI